MPDSQRLTPTASPQSSDTRLLERAAGTIRLGGRADDRIAVPGDVRNDSERMWEALQQRRRDAA